MKHSQIVSYYLHLVEQAEMVGLKITPWNEKFHIVDGLDTICIADDLNVVAGFLKATEHYNKQL